MKYKFRLEIDLDVDAPGRSEAEDQIRDIFDVGSLGSWGVDVKSMTIEQQAKP